MRKILVIACLAVIAAGCYNDKGDKLYPMPSAVVCDTVNTISYAKDIMPVFAKNCSLSGCHSATPPNNGYDFSTYDGVKLAAANNRLVGAINWESGYSPMPKGMAKLSQCDIDKITRWTLRGANNN